MFTRVDLENYLRKIFGLGNSEPLPSMIIQQITRYTRELRLTPREIAEAIQYYGMTGQTLVPKYGIGIVPVIIEESRRYYYAQNKKQEQQAEAVTNQGEKRVVVCKRGRPLRRAIPLIDMNKLGGEDSE